MIWRRCRIGIRTHARDASRVEGKETRIRTRESICRPEIPLVSRDGILSWTGRRISLYNPWIRISRSRSTYPGLFSTLTVWHHVFSCLGGSRSGGILLGVDRYCCHLFSRKASVVSIGRAESVSVRCVDQQSGSGGFFSLTDRQHGSPAMMSRHFPTATRNFGRVTI